MQNSFSLCSRRSVLMGFFTSIIGLFFKQRAVSASTNSSVISLDLSNDQWKERLSPEVYKILRQEGTERPFSSLLNDEKRNGKFHCAGCDLALFSSETKFDSGTGWPSFWDHLPNSIETKSDFKLIVPRIEYHCSQCGGHQGHVFNDGPKPTGKRFCNNGLALIFKPSS